MPKLSALLAVLSLTVFSPSGATVAFDHVLFEGSVTPGANLRVNGQPVDVGPDGLFIEWLPLKVGTNALRLESSAGGETTARDFTVTSRPPQPLPETPIAIAPGSATPSADLKLYDLSGSLEERTVQLAFRGSLGGSATFSVGNRGPFPMQERGDGSGTYEGSLVLNPNDSFQDAPITVRLTGKDGTTVSAAAGGRLSMNPSSQLRVGVTTAEEVGLGVNPGTTALRNGPQRNYILYPKLGEKFVVVGEDGDTYRAQLTPTQTVNLPRAQVELLPEGTPLPHVTFSRIETRVTPDFTQVRFLLPERVPFTVEQTAQPGDQHLEVRLYNTESDVDFIVSAFPDDLVRNVGWVQEQDGVVRVRVDLKTSQQWGWNSFYEGTTLVLQVKRPPSVSLDFPLRGRRIVIDPGHGGTEFGGAGALRSPEKNLTLPIALKLAGELRALGAQVTLTRETDVTVPLYDRPLLAEEVNADVLLSVHANALPDGADPNNSRGAGAYYFWPQARPLADSLLGEVLKNVPEVGNDGIHFQNLALTRPSSQLSVLVETAFLTDKGNLRLLMSEAGQEKLARALALGLAEFYRAQAGR